MPEEQIRKNLDFVKGKKPELLEKYRDKYLVIVNQQVTGSFDTYAAAADSALRQFGDEQGFLIYHMIEDESAQFLMNAVL